MSDTEINVLIFLIWVRLVLHWMIEQPAAGYLSIKPRNRFKWLKPTKYSIEQLLCLFYHQLIYYIIKSDILFMQKTKFGNWDYVFWLLVISWCLCWLFGSCSWECSFSVWSRDITITEILRCWWADFGDFRQSEAYLFPVSHLYSNLKKPNCRYNFIFCVQIWAFYWSSLLTYGKKANKRIFPNVELLL